MQDPVLRRLFLGFIQIHILRHAAREPIYGAWMMEELARHGYDISAGTLYPIFHNLEKDELLTVDNRLENGKIRKYYTITSHGLDVLEQAKEKIKEFSSFS